MRVMRSGGVNFPNLPVLHLQSLTLWVLLALCIAVSGYSYYRYKGGKSFRRMIRKRLRRWRKRAEERSAAS
jgi:hypothetical protein